ncbi:ABC transporter permease [Mesorhizobium sp. M4B.F.Ca.ET.215.01.1.1]|uniref:ABC transporter permease n=1 Tax=Mesorhizobium abyssinicae TaxID=1209958 RepID=A0ABU5AGV9_9HYPH|nr:MULTISPECIES: ABC transporter permease [Mesorhizobium]RVC62710.1 ABC transporter permease [Mesorhizobium sp. M4B.F.Ca.ET.088.02.2.1]MDX8432778.1 ABC transporter permease [Mesorhizobium abyssinicae]MDX8536510.1 ABC transporter permease [Mesorhizobium abyssinicae]RUW27641.1 ABC transporter permease [Mesorhizobium sp. M4B.F.Ca.ET.013.02.1.1]RVD45697.1 ABC transporter permease [Mesorhizobium sp. M4B.F.Ca.ET.019.03.1.1]
MSTPYAKLPAWADYGLIPVINLFVAFVVAGFVVVLVGENPFRAAVILVQGAFGKGTGIAFTLFYATTFIFSGLSVAVAAHCGLFNIGGEGQGYIAGLGIGVVCLAFDSVLPWWLTFPLAIVAAAAMGALWALIPAYLQARRGSHIVITTIMFNFIAASVMVYALVGFLKPLGSMAPQTRTFLDGAQLPKLNWVIELFGAKIRSAPLNVCFLLALLMAFLVWLLIWRTRLGYEMRTYGHSAKAARYAGISETRIVIIAMMISGALAGMMALNPTMGDQHNVALDFVSGAGFVGIAVALMGRLHPVGIVLAAILFGMLYQGGAELAFEMPAISRDMIVIIQGLVILFAGALEHMFRPYIQALFASISPKTVGIEAVKGKGA